MYHVYFTKKTWFHQDNNFAPFHRRLLQKMDFIFFKMCNYRSLYWCHYTYLHVCYTIWNCNQDLIQELAQLFIALSEIAKPPQKLDIEAIVYYQKITSINQPTRDGKHCYQHQHLDPKKTFNSL